MNLLRKNAVWPLFLFGILFPNLEATAQTEEQETSEPPATMGELLGDKTWQFQQGINISTILDGPIIDLLGNPSAEFRDGTIAELADAPIRTFYGAIFSQYSQDFVYDEATLEFILGKRTIPSDGSGWSKDVQITRCSTVSRNEVSDGTATTFQFAENSLEGYSLHLAVYNYGGPGKYNINEKTLNFARFVPNALGGSAVATRHVENITRGVSQFDKTTGLGGFLSLRELEDGSLFGEFSFRGVGSKDIAASEKGATDQFFVSTISGVFRTASLKQPVVNNFEPLPMFGLDVNNQETPVPLPKAPIGVEVLAKSDCSL